MQTVAVAHGPSSAGVLPKRTNPPARWAPVMVTAVPPVVGPEAGLIPLMLGGEDSRYQNRSAVLVALTPPGVVTCTSTTPMPAGEEAVHHVSAQETFDAGTDPR